MKKRSIPLEFILKIVTLNLHMITDELLEKIAKLAHLTLSADEKVELGKNLSSIFAHFNELESLDTTNVEPMFQAHGTRNVFREDEVKPHLPIEEALKNAPDASGRFFRVPLIIESTEE